MPTLDRPREIIGYCLKPLELDTASSAYRETYARLEHVLKTYQLALLKSEGRAAVAVDFSRMPALTINEQAHGHE